MNKADIFQITGLGGRKTLSGTIAVNGAKNSALKAMAASILFDGPVKLFNVPSSADVETMSKILIKLGAKVSWQEDNGKKVLTIDTRNMNSTDIDPKLAGSMRASIVLSGPMLGRFGKLTFPAPGGCVIGARPIDLFTNGYKIMGGETILDESKCLFQISAEKLIGSEIVFPKISVGATETLMMAAVLAHGITVLKNCALEPEIGNVAEWLNACGAEISGIGTSTLTINGTGGRLLKATTDYTAIPDRIEAGSFLILGALCASDLVIDNCEPKHLAMLIDLLKTSGVPIETKTNQIVIAGNTKPNSSFKSFDVATAEYPGFATDLQAQIVTFLTQSTGQSLVTENIFESRFKYTEDLSRVGAKIVSVNPRQIEVAGPTTLGKMGEIQEFNAHDIRAGFALVVAALVGEGNYKITNVQLIDRGYERLEERLSKLGAVFERI